MPHVESVKPDIIWDMNDCCPPDDTEDKYRGKVDLIFMLGVMDYVINPNFAMENVELMLNEGGTAWVEFPFAYAHHEPLMEEGCRYSEGCINRLAKQSNLEIVEIIRKMEVSGLLRQWYSAERQRAAKDYPYHGVTGFIVKFKKV